MGLWAKASRARRTGRGVLFVGPPWLPEAHFIGTLQHRVSPVSGYLGGFIASDSDHLAKGSFRIEWNPHYLGPGRWPIRAVS